MKQSCFFFKKKKKKFHSRVQLYFVDVLYSHYMLCCLVYGFHNHFDVLTVVHPIHWLLRYYIKGEEKQIWKSFWFFFERKNVMPNIHLKSDAKRFFWLTRSLMLVRKLDECISSSAEKKVSDGFSDVREMVRWTSRASDSSDLILLSIDWSDVNWSGWVCGAECDIISLGIWNSYNFNLISDFIQQFNYYWRVPRDHSFENSQLSVWIRIHLIWVLAYEWCDSLLIWHLMGHWVLMLSYYRLVMIFDLDYRLGVHMELHV